MNFPENLRSGQFVMACTHVLEGTAYSPVWGGPGRAVSDENSTVTVMRFDASVICKKCASINPSSVVLRRTKFYDNKLNIGWWEFAK